jgi:hypothetical protein
MTKMRELPRALSGASTATADLVARSSPHDQLSVLVGLADAYDLRLSQATIRGASIRLSTEC